MQLNAFNVRISYRFVIRMDSATSCPLALPHRYPVLQWQARAARRAAGRLAQAGGWLRERAVLCRYAHVPLSNLGGDSAVAVADVLMARRCGGEVHPRAYLNGGTGRGRSQWLLPHWIDLRTSSGFCPISAASAMPTTCCG